MRCHQILCHALQQSLYRAERILAIMQYHAMPYTQCHATPCHMSEGINVMSAAKHNPRCQCLCAAPAAPRFGPCSAQRWPHLPCDTHNSGSASALHVSRCRLCIVDLALPLGTQSTELLSACSHLHNFLSSLGSAARSLFQRRLVRNESNIG